MGKASGGRSGGVRDEDRVRIAPRTIQWTALLHMGKGRRGLLVLVVVGVRAVRVGVAVRPEKLRHADFEGTAELGHDADLCADRERLDRRGRTGRGRGPGRLGQRGWRLEGVGGTIRIRMGCRVQMPRSGDNLGGRGPLGRTLGPVRPACSSRRFVAEGGLDYQRWSRFAGGDFQFTALQ